MRLTSPPLVSPGWRDARPQRIYNSNNTQSPGLTETIPSFLATLPDSASPLIGFAGIMFRIMMPASKIRVLLMKMPAFSQLAFRIHEAVVTTLSNHQSKSLLLAVAVSTYAISSPATAAEANADLDNLNQLITANRFQDAYSLAGKMIAEH